MSYKYLSCEERTIIQLGLEQDCTPSSISRELERNGWSNPATVPKKRGRPPKPFAWAVKANDIWRKIIRANRKLGSKKSEALH